MTAQGLYTFLFDWITPVVAPLPVVRAYQNRAKPATAYVAIEDDQSWKPFGRPTNYAHGLANITYDYTCCPVFWEVGGFGDSLRAILEDLAKLKTKEAFKAAGIGILSTPTIQTMPWLSQETEFIREHRLELYLAVANGRTDPDMTFIETVQITNQIGGIA